VEKKAKRARRDELNHSGEPHVPRKCPRCRANILLRRASRPRSSADASTQTDNIGVGHGGTRDSALAYMQKEGLGVGYPADHSSYADDPGSDSTVDNTPGGMAVAPHWASSQALTRWLEANTVGPGSVPPPQPDRERHPRPLQTDGYPRHEQQPATTLDHDRLLNEQRERLKQQAALEDGEEPSARRRWNGPVIPREEVLRRRQEKKLHAKAIR
jgi:hypothetical protein